jgi:transposase
VAIVASLPVLNNLPQWRQRLFSPAFLQPPWHDHHPARLAIDEALPHDSMVLAHTVDDLVDVLDLQKLIDSYSGRGSTPHRPDLMLKAVLFLTQRGIHSPAAWTVQAVENRVLQWLLRDSHPSRARWFDFRVRLLPFIDDFNKQFLQQARRLGLLDIDVPILDGTLLGANSTRHKLLNKDTLARRLQQLHQAIAADQAPPLVVAVAAPTPTAGADSSAAAAACLDRDDTTAAVTARPAVEPTGEPAGKTGASEAVAGSFDLVSEAGVAGPILPEQQGVAPKAVNVCGQEVTKSKDPATASLAPAEADVANSSVPAQPAWMATTAKGREQQAERYLKAQKELDKRLDVNSQRRKEDRKPVDQVRISPGDPEATLGYDKEKVYRPLFNVQLVSDLKTDFCLAYGIFSGPQDAATLKPMLGRIEYFTGEKVKRLLHDAGYTSGANLRLAEGEHIDVIAPWQENDYTKDKKKNKQIPKDEFKWNEELQTYICPEGHELK